MRATRGRSVSASASGGLSAEAGVADSGGAALGFESVEGGGEGATGDGGANSDDGGATIVKPEDDSVFEERLLARLDPFLRGSACEEDAVSSATSETMPKNLNDVTLRTLRRRRPAGEPSLKKKA